MPGPTKLQVAPLRKVNKCADGLEEPLKNAFGTCSGGPRRAEATRRADARALRAGNRLASTSSANTCAPVLAMPDATSGDSRIGNAKRGNRVRPCRGFLRTGGGVGVGRQ